MNSFSKAHKLYLFELKHGRHKLAYGLSPEHALEILSYRLSPKEMAQVIREKYMTINQRDLGQVVEKLG